MLFRSFANGNHFKGIYSVFFDELIGDMTFKNGTKFKGTIRKEDKKKYEGKLFINDDVIKGIFDSDFKKSTTI